MASNTSYACRHGLVITEKPVPVEFHKVSHAGIDIIQEIGACGMSGDLNALPRAQVSIERLALPLQILASGNKKGVFRVALLRQFGNTAFEIGDREFKVKGLDIHGM
jgi:hypothetical protein